MRFCGDFHFWENTILNQKVTSENLRNSFNFFLNFHIKQTSEKSFFQGKTDFFKIYHGAKQTLKVFHRNT